jgi:serine/threonine protein phosphatase PrpC
MNQVYERNPADPPGPIPFLCAQCKRLSDAGRRILHKIFPAHGTPPREIADAQGRAFGISDMGRRTHNEDAILIHALDGALLLAVADGAGGQGGGAEASSLAVETLKECVCRGYRREAGGDELAELLREAFCEADRRIKASPHNGAATTLVAAILGGERAVIANCGDSRAYLIGRSPVFRTRDHTLVRDLVERGIISEEEVPCHPLRALLTHALGATPATDTYDRPLSADAVLVLCSDGLHSAFHNDEIVAYTGDGSAEEIARRLVQKAKRCSEDNISVVVARAYTEGETKNHNDIVIRNRPDK